LSFAAGPLAGPNQIAVAGHDLNPSLRIPKDAGPLPEGAR